MKVNILAYGINTTHDKDYISEASNGFANYIVLCFKTPFKIRTRHGIELGEPGDCVIFTPNFPQYHTNIQGDTRGFINTWMHFSGALLSDWILDYQIPTNQIIKMEHYAIFDEVFLKIDSELTDKLPNYEQLVTSYLKSMFIQISRQVVMSKNSIYSSLKESKLYKTRQIMLNNYADAWDLDTLCEMSNLSKSRFCFLYKRLFHISPINELIEKRIEGAKELLLTTDLTIENVALRCGFNDLYHFSHIFKKRTSLSPQYFRGK